MLPRSKLGGDRKSVELAELRTSPGEERFRRTTPPASIHLPSLEAVPDLVPRAALPPVLAQVDSGAAQVTVQLHQPLAIQVPQLSAQVSGAAQPHLPGQNRAQHGGSGLEAIEGPEAVLALEYSGDPETPPKVFSTDSA